MYTVWLATFILILLTFKKYEIYPKIQISQNIRYSLTTNAGETFERLQMILFLIFANFAEESAYLWHNKNTFWSAGIGLYIYYDRHSNKPHTLEDSPSHSDLGDQTSFNSTYENESQRSSDADSCRTSSYSIRISQNESSIFDLPRVSLFFRKWSSVGEKPSSKFLKPIRIPCKVQIFETCLEWNMFFYLKEFTFLQNFHFCSHLLIYLF